MGKKGLNIYHRKDGRWEGRYKDGFKADGKPKYRSVYAKSYGEVKEVLIHIQNAEMKPKSTCFLTVQQIFTEWLSIKKLKVKESTIVNYEFKFRKHLLSAFGNLKFSDISAKMVYDFIHKKLHDGLSGKYIADMIILLKSIAKYAGRTYYCANQIADVELPKAENHEIKPYSREQQTVLTQELLKDTDLSKMGILLCAYTGIRIGELCALQWKDIDFQNQTLEISKTCQRIRNNGDTATKLVITAPKSRSSVRMIPIPSFLMKLLKSFAPSDNNAYLLSGCDRIIEPRTVQYRFQAILRKAKLPSVNFHSLRHYFATFCIEIGFDVKTLSEILGHGSVQITLNRYVHSSINRKRECMERIRLNLD